jgi:predicted DNA-binding protein (MmcQ/YjbR family)
MKPTPNQALERTGMSKSSLKPLARNEKRRVRVMELCRSLPEVQARDLKHIAFLVRKRTFAYYLHDHHGDGRVSLCVKTSSEEHRNLIQLSPDRYFLPPYIGKRGWVGLYLDLETVDWQEASDLVLGSYRLIAPKRLALLAR